MKRLSLIITALLLGFGMTKTQAQVSVGVGISVGIAPPAIPVYVQPPCPVEGYLWTPGYWYWGASGYYWVPGVWCRPARVGFLWTPGYWGFEGGHYWWHGGYWGAHVGFYGGVCYGFGYGGRGFYGGRWEGGAFRYNTAVCSVNSTVIHNTYVDRTVINNTTVNHSSFNGPGGVTARPSESEQSAARESHVQSTSEQQNNEHAASTNPHQLASANGGHPSTTARSSVGGQRFNSAGHSMNAARATANNNRAAVSANHAAVNNNHAAANNNHAAMHSPNAGAARQGALRNNAKPARQGRAARGGGKMR